MEKLKQFGISVLKFLTGTSKNGILKNSTWTSEDINNPIYSRKKPLSIQLLKQIFIKDRLDLGAKHFDKGMRIGLGIMRLHPTFGIGMNIMDAIEAGKQLDGDSYASNMLGGFSKGVYNSRNISSNSARALRNKTLGKGILGGAGILMGALDYYFDIKDLYNTINE